MKASILLFLWLPFLFNTSCSNNAGVNRVVTPNTNIARANENRNARNNSDQPSRIVESSPVPKRKDIVLFDGKNYIKKSGWKKPSKNDTYIDETYDPDTVKAVTKSGKQVKTNTISYGCRGLSLYSEDFYHEGRDLDYLKGKLDLWSFLEMSAKGKVFFYSVTAQKVVSKNDLPEGPFGYRIIDADGDGIFETLLGHYDEIVVPDWVLK